MDITFLATPVMYEKIDEWFWILVLILDFYQTLLINICVIYRFVEQHLLYKTTSTTTLSFVSLCRKSQILLVFRIKMERFFSAFLLRFVKFMVLSLWPHDFYSCNG